MTGVQTCALPISNPADGYRDAPANRAVHTDRPARWSRRCEVTNGRSGLKRDVEGAAARVRFGHGFDLAMSAENGGLVCHLFHV